MEVQSLELTNKRGQVEGLKFAIKNREENKPRTFYIISRCRSFAVVFYNFHSFMKCRVRLMANKKKETYYDNPKRNKLKTCNM